MPSRSLSSAVKAWHCDSSMACVFSASASICYKKRDVGRLGACIAGARASGTRARRAPNDRGGARSDKAPPRRHAHLLCDGQLGRDARRSLLGRVGFVLVLDELQKHSESELGVGGLFGGSEQAGTRQRHAYQRTGCTLRRACWLKAPTLCSQSLIWSLCALASSVLLMRSVSRSSPTAASSSFCSGVN